MMWEAYTMPDTVLGIFRNIILFNPHNNVNFQKTKVLEEIQLEWTYQVFKDVD